MYNWSKNIAFTILIVSGVSILSAKTEKQIQQEIDSVRQIIKTTKSDTELVNAISYWDNYIWDSDPALDLILNLRIDSICQANLRKQITNAENYFYRENIANANNNMGLYYWNLGQYKKAELHLKKCLKLSKEINYRKGISMSINNLGNIYKDQGNYNLALKYYKAGIKKDIEKKDYYSAAIVLNNIGIIYLNQGNSKKAIDFFTKALTIYEFLNNKKGIASSTLSIGNVYLEYDVDKAIEYYQRSLDLDKELNNKLDITKALSNLGSAYEKKKELTKAMAYFNQALKIETSVGNKKGASGTMSSIGTIYLDLEDYDKALSYYEKSAEIKDSIGDKKGRATALTGIANVHLLKNDIKNSSFYGKKALRLAQEVGSLVEIQNASEVLYQVFKKQNDPRALNMYELYVESRDSILNLNSQQEIIRQEYKHNYEKQKALDDKEHEKLMAIGKTKQEQQFIIIILTTCAVAIVLALLIIIYRRLKITSTQKILIEDQKNIIEMKHQEVEHSINYAKRIQMAILPPNSLLKQHLPEHFVFYKPKDVVAGDFYWMENTGDLVFFAVADCTGHGVPGAMVSVVCHGALNRCIREYKLTKPSDILNKTRELVINTFAKSEEQVHDGMDISLCTWNKKTNQLQFAGAHNPLYILKKNSELEIIKADKQPIGYFENASEFTNHDIDTEKGDRLFLFSDGFADQFGGPNGKKYSYKAFREFLIKYSTSPIETMHTILDEEFKHWKGSEEQIDDVCVLGINV